MQYPGLILDILNQRSIKNNRIDKIYKYFYNIEWYKYISNISNSKSIILDDNIDIDTLCNTFKYERYYFKDKDSNELIFEMIYQILYTIYKSTFTSSLVFNCATSLYQIKHNSNTTIPSFFISIDMSNKKTLDCIDDHILLDILKLKIKDGRFIELIRRLLKYYTHLKDSFIYNQTYSNTPICINKLYTLLVNIYLSQLDRYLYYDKKITSFTRYFTQSLISLTNIFSFKEVLDLKDNIDNFISNKLYLKNNVSIIIRNSTNKKDPISYLNYNILYDNNKLVFLIPHKVFTTYKRKFCKNDKPYQITNRIPLPITTIVSLYQQDIKSITQYYKYCRNQKLLNRLKWYIETSMLKCISSKYKITINRLYKKYKSYIDIDKSKYVVFKVSDKVYYGGIPFKHNKLYKDSIIEDNIRLSRYTR